MLQINSNIKDDFQVVLLLSCFVDTLYIKWLLPCLNSLIFHGIELCYCIKGKLTAGFSTRGRRMQCEPPKSGIRATLTLSSQQVGDAVGDALIRYPIQISFIFPTRGRSMQCEPPSSAVSDPH